MKQLIKNQVTDRVVRLGDYIPLRMARSAITSVNYNYVNASRVPASGEITTSGVQLRFNNVDSDGVDHGAFLSHVKTGDTVTINGQSATITTDPIWTSSGYWYFDVDAWPFMANGNYEVSITQEEPAWSPAELFASGEQGAWYDPSDLTTMFQDIAGTTPVTADGQTVGKILDKSGRGNHATAPTDAARPLYKTDGTYHWMQFDGVDDSLKTGVFDLTTTNKISIFTGIKKINDAATIVCELGSAVAALNGSFYVVSGTDGSFLAYSSCARGTTGISTSQTSYLTAPTGIDTAVLAMNHSIPDDLSTIRRNGVSGSNGTGDKGTGNFNSDYLNIGARNSTTLYFNSNIYSLIIRGALSTTQEITDTEEWVAAKTGVVLP